MSKPLAAGRLSHRVSLERPDNVMDSDGAVEVVWLPVASVWAEVAPVSGREYVAAAALQSKVSTRFTIRRRDDVRAAWRILHRGRIFNIEAVLSDADSGLEYLTLPCSEGVNEG